MGRWVHLAMVVCLALATNATRRDMTQNIARFELLIEPGDEVFFFYAGHGVAIGSENYLIATDLSIPAQGQESLVEDEAVSVDTIVRRVQSRGAAVAMVVLDACRDMSSATRSTSSPSSMPARSSWNLGRSLALPDEAIGGRGAWRESMIASWSGRAPPG